MEQIFHLTLLFDFYGDLLTDKQCSVFEMYHFDDLSLNEIGEAFGITPQGVSDMLRRTHKSLSDYEETLHLVKNYLLKQEIKGDIYSLIESIDTLKDKQKQQLLNLIDSLPV